MAHQWACFCLKKHLCATRVETLYHMYKNGPESNLIYLIAVCRYGCEACGVWRVASMWRIVMNPHDIIMEDISYLFFDMVLGVIMMLMTLGWMLM